MTKKWNTSCRKCVPTCQNEAFVTIFLFPKPFKEILQLFFIQIDLVVRNLSMKYQFMKTEY